MSRVYEREFRIRAYECDAYGHVNHANYLRFMQEAAIEASADAGFDTAAYDALGQLWLIRETDIEYHAPLFFGDVLTVRTWVADIRRIRSRRMYHFLRPGDEAPVATAATDWVFLDRAGLRPIQVPEEIVRAFFPDGSVDAAPPRRPFPEPLPPPAGGPHVHRRRVAWRDLDYLGHVNNAVYLSYNEDAGLDHARQSGYPLTQFFEEGWGIFTRRTQIEYRQPAHLDDVLDVETWLSPPRNSSITRYYQVRRAGDAELLSRSQSIWVTVDIQTGHPIPIPDSFLKAFKTSISAG